MEVEDDTRNVSFAYFAADIRKVSVRFMYRSRVFLYFFGRVEGVTTEMAVCRVKINSTYRMGCLYRGMNYLIAYAFMR